MLTQQKELCLSQISELATDKQLESIAVIKESISAFLKDTFPQKLDYQLNNFDLTTLEAWILRPLYDFLIHWHFVTSIAIDPKEKAKLLAWCHNRKNSIYELEYQLSENVCRNNKKKDLIFKNFKHFKDIVKGIKIHDLETVEKLNCQETLCISFLHYFVENRKNKIDQILFSFFLKRIDEYEKDAGKLIKEIKRRIWLLLNEELSLCGLIRGEVNAYFWPKFIFTNAFDQPCVLLCDELVIVNQALALYTEKDHNLVDVIFLLLLACAAYRAEGSDMQLNGQSKLSNINKISYFGVSKGVVGSLDVAENRELIQLCEDLLMDLAVE